MCLQEVRNHAIGWTTHPQICLWLHKGKATGRLFISANVQCWSVKQLPIYCPDCPLTTFFTYFLLFQTSDGYVEIKCAQVRSLWLYFTSFFSSIVCIILPLKIGPRDQPQSVPVWRWWEQPGVGRTRGQFKVCPK